MSKENIIVILLSIAGLYFIVDHYPPLPLNHESLGLYNHTIHRIIGTILLLAAGYILWRGRKKK
jgi:hypothetical protein